MASIKALHGGILTNEHAASSYGQPVYVYEGKAYGPNDMIDMGLFGHERAYDHALRPRHAGAILDKEQQKLKERWRHLAAMTS